SSSFIHTRSPTSHTSTLSLHDALPILSPRLEESVLRSAKRFSDGCPHMVRFAMQIDATNSILEISNSFGLSAKRSVHGHGTVRPCTTTVLMEWTEPQ